MKSLKLVFSREFPNHLLIYVKNREGGFHDSDNLSFSDEIMTLVELVGPHIAIGSSGSLILIPVEDSLRRKFLENAIVGNVTKEQFSKKIDVVPTKKDIGTLCEFSDDNKNWSKPFELVAILPQEYIENRYICCSTLSSLDSDPKQKSNNKIKYSMGWAYAKKFNNSSKDDTIEIKPKVVNDKNRLLTTYTWKMEE
jgi:hypothetical protein